MYINHVQMQKHTEKYIATNFSFSHISINANAKKPVSRSKWISFRRNINLIS